MTQASSAEWEMAIVLPLGAVASQLQRIEAQLRLLNIKALDFAKERENRPLQALIESRLEKISETLVSVAGLVSDIEDDISPSRAGVARVTGDDETVSLAADSPSDERRLQREVARSAQSARKPHPDRDD